MIALELVLPPDDAARLPRLKLLAGLKTGRLRRRAIGIVWHDTSDGALAQDGLALAESRGTWRLERLVPDGAFWPPGAPPPVLEQAAALDRISHELPAGLLRTARFEGELTVLPLQRDGARLRIELLRGTVGWARKRRPACRLTLVAEVETDAAATSTMRAEAARLADARAKAARAGAARLEAAPVDAARADAAQADAAQADAAQADAAQADAAQADAARADSAQADAARAGAAGGGATAVSAEAGAPAAEAGAAAAAPAALDQPATIREPATGEAAVFALAQALAEDLALAVPTASLAAEARAAATGATPAPRHAGAPQLPPGLTVAEAFGFVLAHLADVILYNAPLAAAGRSGPDPVHEMRVAVRRLRSAIALFRPAVGCPAVDAASAGLKALADRLAPARDWDVFVAETAAAVAKVLPDDPSLRRLRAASERRRRQAYAALRDWLRGREFRHLGIALAGLAGGQAWRTAFSRAQAETLALGLDEFAHRALARRLRRLAAAGADIEHLDAAALHAIRLRAKRMRYVAEVFAPLYPGKATRRFMRRLARLQDRLGRLNDSTVADGLLATLGAGAAGRAHAAGLVRGFLAARSGDARGRIARAWQRFHRLEPFWS